MPRLRISSEEQSNKHFKIAIARQKAVMEMTDQELADSISLSRTTIWRIKQNPDGCSLKEFRLLAKKLHWTQEDICNILGVKFIG